MKIRFFVLILAKLYLILVIWDLELISCSHAEQFLGLFAPKFWASGGDL